MPRGLTATLTVVASGWLNDGSEDEVRRAIEVAMPGLRVESLRIRPRHVASNQLWWSSNALVNGAFVVKYAWSQVRAARLHREGVLLQRLKALAPGLRVPRVIALHDNPVTVVTQYLTGDPLSWGVGSDLRGERLDHVSGRLADFLVTLHGLPATEVLRGLPAVNPTAQADTTMLRARYGRLVDERRAHQVLAWCDWVDAVLSTEYFQAVVVHGDLHGYNQLWDFDSAELVAVLDLEQCGLGDPHFDFRYLAGNSASTDLMMSVARTYERSSGARFRLDRAMAWHVLTVLGDALWRTEAGVDLPGGGDASSYVDELRQRLHEVGTSTS